MSIAFLIMRQKKQNGLTLCHIALFFNTKAFFSNKDIITWQTASV